LRARELNGPTMPIIFKDAKDSEIVNSPRSVGTAAGQLERMRKEAKRSDTLSMPLPSDFIRRIFSMLDWRPQEIRWVVDPASLGGIVSAVRKVIFDWSLKLETAGIQGDGISFDELAKRKAHEPAVINSVGRIEKFYSVIGNASGSGSTINVTQTFDRTELNLTDARSIVGQIEDVLGKLKVNSLDRDSISSELTTISAELATANPDQSKIRTGFKSVLETVGRGTRDVAKDIFAAGVTAAIKTLLGMP
jgi:AbiTii